MGNINTLVARMRYWCQNGNLGYDQNQRWNIKYGGECDCSSLVIHCLQEAGFNTGNATYTGNLSAALTARGWKRLPNNGRPQAGDILLNDVHHVAVYLGGGQLAQASIDERGRARGGRSGDQGTETNVRSYYNRPWNCYLRYVGSQTSTNTTISQEIGDDMALLIRCKDAHAGYGAGDIVLWQPNADIPFYHVPNHDALNMVKQAYPGIKTVESKSKAPWIVRAYQGTPGSKTGYGKR